MSDNLPSWYIPEKVLAFVDQLVYCKEEYKWALTMALAVSHAREWLTAVPYILATSDQPSSGKSTIAFDIPMMLGFNVESIDRTTTRDALNNLFLQRITPNTAWDDIGKIFGANGTNGSTTNFYTMLVRSYKKNAVTKMSRNGTTMSVPTYGMAFLNGLQNAVPKDLFTRCIWFQMEEAPDAYPLRDVLDDSTEADGKILKEALHGWAASRGPQFKQFMKDQVRRIHPKLAKRRRQLWGPLFAAAHAAGGQWPQRIFDAFVAIALDASEKPRLVPEQFTLLDTAKILIKKELGSIFTSDLIEELQALPDGQYYRDVETEYLVKNVLVEALGQPQAITTTMIHGPNAGIRGKARGYDAVKILNAAADLHDMLYPPMEQDIEDPLDEELAFEPVPTPKMMERPVAA